MPIRAFILYSMSVLPFRTSMYERVDECVFFCERGAARHRGGPADQLCRFGVSEEGGVRGHVGACVWEPLAPHFSYIVLLAPTNR